MKDVNLLNRIALSGFLASGLLLAWTAEPAAAQTTQDRGQDRGATAEEAMQQAKKTYGPPPPRTQCKKNGSKDEIVVCAEEEQDDSQYRVKSTSELDPNSREALRDGVPRAPDVAGDGIFKGKATVASLCVIGGCPPPPAYMFDLSELPEAPEGSDADLIGKGKKAGN